MNHATRITASALGIYAGLLGMAHGIYEVLQGNVRQVSMMFNAIGPPCQASKTAHACFPAMSIVSNMRVTGVLAILIGLLMVTWAVAFIQRKHGGLVMILLSTLLLLVGGGFIPPMIGILSGTLGSWINIPLTWRLRNLSDSTKLVLTKMWPWSLVIFFSWILLQMLLGVVYTELVLKMSSLFLFIEFGLVVLVALTAFAFDIQNKSLKT